MSSQLGDSAQTQSRPAWSPETRVLIIGAGPTGLGAGVRLAELGHTNFRIVDRNPFSVTFHRPFSLISLKVSGFSS